MNPFSIRAPICIFFIALLSLAVEANQEPDTAEQFWDADCVITPVEVIELGSPVPGVLESVLVDRSDIVEKGQPVAMLESQVERASLELAKAQALIETEIQLRAVSVEYDNRSTNRLAALHRKKLASAQERDRAEREAKLSDWKLKQARDALFLRQLELKRAEAVVERLTIRSPVEGVVVQRYRAPGEYVEDQPLMKLVRLDKLHVESIVPMRLFGLIHPGMKALVEPEHDGLEPIQAMVDLVDSIGDAASGTFGVRVELPNPEGKIPAGLKCRLRFVPEGLQADAGVLEDPAGDVLKGFSDPSSKQRHYASNRPLF
ncbi:MAG: efflux RND transporter periplasmic adaptor subunit [Gammaproteobacteria bacterium]|nr:efflux RND transporter periplasmic adaptor subunit [Gammaproteobacteria bacterium]